jgi:hypothetical protein
LDWWKAIARFVLAKAKRGVFRMASEATDVNRYPGRRFLWAGIALAILGPAAYAFQLWARQLFTPWYVPTAGTLGLALVIMALAYGRSVGRVLALVLVGVLAAGEWYLMVRLAKLPAYAGPLEVGKPVPAFEAQLADGSRFGSGDLNARQNTLLVFFRGRM